MMAKKLSASALRKLRETRARGSSGKWRMGSHMFGGSVTITTDLREMSLGENGREGSIASVSAERYISDETDGVRKTRTVPIKTAMADAVLMVEAVNALEPMIDMLLAGRSADEAGWLIEFPADRYGPIRYWSAGEPPVVNASHATRFSREEDAQRIMRWQALKNARVTEHAWEPAA